MSGAGKSTALKILEDQGYFCADNLPIPLIEKFAELSWNQQREYDKVALGMDVRSGSEIQSIQAILERLVVKGISYEILFLDASDSVLLKRYKETRRSHPLAKDGRIDEGIRKERQAMAFLKEHADIILDTSTLLTRELRSEMEKIFVNRVEYRNIYITVLSFGFKYGIPADSDLVFDVRFLPNPFYIDELKYLTGNDRGVQDYVMSFPEAEEFVDRLTDLLEFLIPNYIKEGKYQLVIGIGCTGGKHRSVTLANELYRRLKNHSAGYGVTLSHRDI